MTFNREFWDDVWTGEHDRHRANTMADSPPNPHLVREIAELEPGTALEAGCGAGAEAIWLASRGWQVTAVDISQDALDHAARRAAAQGVSDLIHWQRADLTVWEPETRFDLMTTHYAHATIPQLDFYERLAKWVVPGGTLLIVGHGHGHGHEHEHGHAAHPPVEASTHATATAADIVERLAVEQWEIVSSVEESRQMRGYAGPVTEVHDVVVRAIRRT